MYVRNMQHVSAHWAEDGKVEHLMVSYPSDISYKPNSQQLSITTVTDTIHLCFFIFISYFAVRPPLASLALIALLMIESVCNLATATWQRDYKTAERMKTENRVSESTDIRRPGATTQPRLGPGSSLHDLDVQTFSTGQTVPSSTSSQSAPSTLFTHGYAATALLWSTR